MKYLYIIIGLVLPTASFAQDAAKATAEGPGLESMVVQLGIIFVVFYFLLIRPQQKKYKAHMNLVSALKKGDKVITGGGFMGVVTKSVEGEKFVSVEIANGVEVQVLRSTITELAEPKVKQEIAKK